LIHSLRLHHLHPAGLSHHDAHTRARHSQNLGEEADALIIRPPINWRRGEIQFPHVAQTACDRRPPGPRMHLHRHTRHSPAALRFATPAATRVSTTSNATASSSQSWLEPSAFCVATVSVYSCGVSQHSMRKSTSSSSPDVKSPSFTPSILVLVP